MTQTNTKTRKTSVRTQASKLKIKCFKILARKALEEESIPALEAICSLAEPVSIEAQGEQE
jgi:hypothetical protein